jgi:hypothetical protein
MVEGRRIKRDHILAKIQVPVIYLKMQYALRTRRAKLILSLIASEDAEVRAG